jgi:hypothetical protein
MDRVFRAGFTDFLYDFTRRTNGLAAQIQKDFLMVR